MFLRISQVAELLGVCIETVRNYEKYGVLKPSHRTNGGHRRYLESDARFFFFGTKTEGVPKLTVCYSRVSSHDQKKDLETQKATLEAYCKMHKIQNIESISDLGSGMNMKKPGLKKLLHLILSRQVERIVICHKDRLLRFGVELLFRICKFFNIEILTLEEEKPASFEEDLARDVICLLTVFTAKLYGKRSHQRRKLRQQMEAA